MFRWRLYQGWHVKTPTSDHRCVVSVPGLPVWACGGHSGTGTGFSPSTSLIPLSVSFHRCSILFLNTAVIRRTGGRSPGTFKQRSTHLNIRQHWIEKYTDVVLFRWTSGFEALKIHTEPFCSGYVSMCPSVGTVCITHYSTAGCQIRQLPTLCKRYGKAVCGDLWDLPYWNTSSLDVNLIG